MSDRWKFLVAFLVAIAACAMRGWFDVFSWRHWAALLVAAGGTWLLTWAIQQYDGSSVRW
jgi:hypothetical protein